MTLKLCIKTWIFSKSKKLGKFSKYRNRSQSQRGGKSIGAARIGEKIEKLEKRNICVARSAEQM